CTLRFSSLHGLLGVRGAEDRPANRLFGAAKPSKPFSVEQTFFSRANLFQSQPPGKILSPHYQSHAYHNRRSPSAPAIR
ncbi:MAG: hypothetical protein LAQ69_42440, partial [Acidobacteriia bacterium]|nr:hypothetical protein [Terriglobia bacterium]